MEERYYVTIKRGERVGFLAGPFKTFGEAFDHVDPAAAKAIEFHPFAAFDSFGVTLIEVPPGAPLAPGVLNKHLGLKLVVDVPPSRH